MTLPARCCRPALESRSRQQWEPRAKPSKSSRWPERYKIQFTVSAETHEKLREVQDLMRHVISDGDVAVIFDRALTVLLADLRRLGSSLRVLRPRVS